MENVDDYEATKSVFWMLARVHCVADNARRRRRVIDKIGGLFLLRADEGMAKMEVMGACTLFFREAFLRLVHAECLEATGNHDAAKAAIARAREYLSTIEAKIPDPEYRKSFLENVPENGRICELAREWGMTA